MIFIFVRVLQFPRLMTGTFGPCSLDSVLLEVKLCFKVHQHNVPPSWSRKLLHMLKASVSVILLIAGLRIYDTTDDFNVDIRFLGKFYIRDLENLCKYLICWLKNCQIIGQGIDIPDELVSAYQT